jgi:hypothetical protein
MKERVLSQQFVTLMGTGALDYKKLFDLKSCCQHEQILVDAEGMVRLWLLKKLLRWYRRHLERQIDIDRWDTELSAKLDAVTILLND